jgi:hypothetical protein
VNQTSALFSAHTTRSTVLAVLQIYAAVSSLSLSFFATAMDAVFDPLANLVRDSIWSADRI